MTQHLKPTSTITAGLWTASTSTLHDDTDEGVDSPDEDATYAGQDTELDVMELLLQAGVDPVSSAGHVMQWRARRHGAWYDVAYLTVELYQGATLIATGSSGHGTSYTTATYMLTSTEADAITDYTDLRMRVQLASSIGTAHLHLTALELTLPTLDTYASARAQLAAPETLGEIAAPAARGQVQDVE